MNVPLRRFPWTLFLNISMLFYIETMNFLYSVYVKHIIFIKSTHKKLINAI